MKGHLISLNQDQLGLLAPAVPPQLVDSGVTLVAPPQLEDALAATTGPPLGGDEVVGVLALHQFAE